MRYLAAALVLLLLLAGVVLVTVTRPDPREADPPAAAPRASSQPPTSPGPAPDASQEEKREDPAPEEPDATAWARYAWSGSKIEAETPPEREPVPRRTVRGHLLRTDGKPVRKATVAFLHVAGNHSWSRVEGRVADDGSFEVPGVPEEWLRGGLEFEAGAEGFIRQTYGMHADDLVTGASIVLRGAVRVRGRFVDGDGRPVAGVRVSGFHGPFSSVSATSDAEGRVSFLWPAGWGGAIYRRHRDYPDGLFRFPSSVVDVDAGDTVLHPARDIAGIVLAPDGSPRSGARVELFGIDNFGRHGRSTTTDAEGRFVFPKRGDELYEVFTSRQAEVDGRRVLLGARAIGLRAGDPSVTLTEAPLRTVRLRLLDARTRKATTAVCFTVQLRRPDEEHTALRQWRNVVSEVDLHATETGEQELSYGSAFHRGVTIRVRFEEAARTVEIELTPKGGR